MSRREAGGVDTVTDNSGSNEHNRLPAEERSGISGKKRRFVDDDDMGYSSKSAAGTVPNSGIGGVSDSEEAGRRVSIVETTVIQVAVETGTNRQPPKQYKAL